MDLNKFYNTSHCHIMLTNVTDGIIELDLVEPISKSRYFQFLFISEKIEGHRTRSIKYLPISVREHRTSIYCTVLTVLCTKDFDEFRPVQFSIQLGAFVIFHEQDSHFRVPLNIIWNV